MCGRVVCGRRIVLAKSARPDRFAVSVKAIFVFPCVWIREPRYQVLVYLEIRVEYCSVPGHFLVPSTLYCMLPLLRCRCLDMGCWSGDSRGDTGITARIVQFQCRGLGPSIWGVRVAIQILICAKTLCKRCDRQRPSARGLESPRRVRQALLCFRNPDTCC